MSTNKTTNYQLHLWEPGDDFLREEFNENHVKLDAALKAQAEELDAEVSALSSEMNTAVANAKQTAASALAAYKTSNDAAVAEVKQTAESGLKLELGSYTGTGTFGSGSSNTLTFSISPKIVIIVADSQEGSHPGALFFAGQQYSNGFGVTSSYGQYGLTLTWGEKSLSWTTKYISANGANAYWQLNASGVTYRYAVIG